MAPQSTASAMLPPATPPRIRIFMSAPLHREVSLPVIDEGPSAKVAAGPIAAAESRSGLDTTATAVLNLGRFPGTGKADGGFQEKPAPRPARRGGRRLDRIRRAIPARARSLHQRRLCPRHPALPQAEVDALADVEGPGVEDIGAVDGEI